MKQSSESSSALHLGVVAIEKEAFESPAIEVANFTLLISTFSCNFWEARSESHLSS